MNFEQNHKQCLEKLIWAVNILQVDVSPTQLSKIAELIVQTMTGPWRYFHSAEHIFEVGGSENPIEMLAALFHDVVYVQVDQSVNFNLSHYITPFVRQVREQLVIREKTEFPPDLSFEIVMSIFGFVPGQLLSPFAGQNEFLSALVAVKVLESFLSPYHLLQVVVCIEATIPFQSASESGLDPSERLYLRLQETNEHLAIGMKDEEVINTIKSAVRLSNRDVGSFAYPSSARFLDSTWSLLPETNHHLRNHNSYTVYQYRVALQKMAGFMNFLQPEIVFKKFKDEPDEHSYQRLVKIASRNIAIARLYLSSKLLTIALIEALSLRIGQDIALSIMVGELPPLGFSGCRLRNFIPNIANAHPPKNELELEVLRLLEVGRIQNYSYDIKNSPLATFVVKNIGFEGVIKMQEPMQEFFKDNISSEEFLDKCHEPMKEAITLGILDLLDTRKTLLSQPKNILNRTRSTPHQSRIFSQ